MNSINEITYKQIGRLDAVQLTELLSKLLYLEAVKCGLPLKDIHVPLNITVGDGGVDGRIFIPDCSQDKWLQSSDWLGEATTIFQCKATPFGHKDCKKEITILEEKNRSIKPAIENVLLNKGTYILFYYKDLQAKSIITIEKSFKAAIKEFNVPLSLSSDIRVYDANKISAWVNQHPTAIMFVLECIKENLPNGFQTWKKWADHNKFKQTFHYNDKLEIYKSKIQEILSESKKAVRIAGLPGMGKTRFALEIFRPNATNTSDRQSVLSSFVLYYDAKHSASSLPDNVVRIRNKSQKVILIVDNCDDELHTTLYDLIDHSESEICMLTLSYDWKNSQNTHVGELNSKTTNDVIDKIIEGESPGLPEENKRKIIEFAQGFPLVAVLLAQDLNNKHKNLGLLNDDDLIKKMLGPRADETNFRNVLRACSIFTYVGYARDKAKIRSFIAMHPHICKLALPEEDKEDFFYEVCQQMQERGIIEAKGDFIFVKPTPLALRLAADWWKYCRPELVEKILDEVQKEHLGSFYVIN